MGNRPINRLITKAEFDALWPDVDQATIDDLWEAFQRSFTSIVTSSDWSDECSMCGKPMPYRYCGMCTHCEMVWNG